MNVLLTGASGLIGSALRPSLTAAGHRITSLVRTRTGLKDREVYWDPVAGQLDGASLEGIEAVIHLAGESIAERWSAEKKRRIVDSRIASTRLLVERLAGMANPPKVFVAASAIGYYGDRGDELLREESAPGSGFLAEVCQQWESAATMAELSGIRTVRLRFGMILSASGGALRKMLPPFRLGLGGKLGSGRQYTSWIAIEDVVGVILHALADPELSGPVNAVAPHPVTNLEFTRTLAKVLRRPAIFPVPAFAVSLAFGEMGKELLLSSARVEPAKLKSSGYRFRFPELEPALRNLLA